MYIYIKRKLYVYLNILLGLDGIPIDLIRPDVQTFQLTPLLLGCNHRPRECIHSVQGAMKACQSLSLPGEAPTASP